MISKDAFQQLCVTSSTLNVSSSPRPIYIAVSESDIEIQKGLFLPLFISKNEFILSLVEVFMLA